ncbi:MAG: spore germination protein [Clostridia bacterium]|nr:spore germination protein [Clostridia bacterium]
MNYSLKERIEGVKNILTSEDILVAEFDSLSGKKFACIYADGIVDKNMIGELVIKPLKTAGKDITAEGAKRMLASPDVKDGKDLPDAVKNISDGNAVLYIDGEEDFYIIGVKLPPGRSVAEPPTQVAVKGPREGFTEDIKINLGLVRKRLKSDKLKIKTITVGKQSQTTVAICYLEGVCPEGLPEKIEKQILNNEIDVIPDSSYVAGFISERPHSLFKRNSTCEKPDIFCAKVSEGRVGIISDGSPIALTVPYMLVEDFQAAEDYYAVKYRSTILRILRLAAVLIGISLPAIYVCAQLFKIQLIPPLLLFKIASSVAGIPLSPSVEIFLTLFVLEVLNEASIRMPKYVGLALSVVGALVLGDTAVKAGIISTPAVIIIAFSAICLYTVPDLVETSTTLRLLFLIVAGSLGTFGLLLTIAFLLCYLVTEQDYGVPLLAPFAPLIARDMKDSYYKADLYTLDKRPRVLRSENKTRMKTKK